MCLNNKDNFYEFLRGIKNFYNYYWYVVSESIYGIYKENILDLSTIIPIKIG